MKTMYTALRCRYRNWHCTFTAAVLLSSMLVACSHEASPADKTKCASPHYGLLQAIAKDAKIGKLSGYDFDQKEIVVLWSSMPSVAEACGARHGRMTVFRSLPGVGSEHGAITVEKMYFDDDVAFMEIGFPPTAVNADVLLRKRAKEWVVVESKLWEN